MVIENHVPPIVKRSASRESLAVMGIALVSYFILLITAWFVVGNNPVDFMLQVGAAVDIAKGKMLYRDIGERIIGQSRLPRPQYPPLYLHALGLVFWFLNVKQLNVLAIMTAKTFLVTFIVLDALLIYLILRPEVGFKLGVAGMLGYMFHPAILGSLVGFHESFLAFFLLLATLSLQRHRSSLSGFFMGLGLLTKQIALVHAWVLIVFMVAFKDPKATQIFPMDATKHAIILVLTVLLGFLPFVLIAPQQVLDDVLLIHLTRNDPNMSIYYYFGAFLDQFKILLVVQVGLMLLLPIHVKRTFGRVTPEFKGSIISFLQLLFLTSFYLANRIFYPHYLAQFIPWLVITFMFFWKRWMAVSRERRLVGMSLGILTISHVVMMLSAGTWGLIWLQDPTPSTMNDHLLYPLSSLIFFLGLAAFLISQFLLLHEITSLMGNEQSNVIRPSL